MNTKNKTGDKLVASMRKSKTGAVARKTTKRPEAEESAAKPKSTAARSASTARRTSTGATSQVRENSYSAGRRVWPD